MNRQGFVGGSDMYRILKGEWHSLWLEKTGRKQPDDLSDVFPVQLGVATEGFHLDWFSKVTGYNIVERGKLFEYTYKNIPLRGMTDGYVEGNLIVECKHTSSYRKMSDMLDMYLGQLHHYMFTSNTPSIAFSVIFGNQHEWCTVSFNEEYWKQCLEKIEEFWWFVDQDVEPQDGKPEPINWADIMIDELKVRDASDDNYFMSLVHDYMTWETHAIKFNNVKKELRAQIADNEREVFCKYLSIKRSKNGSCRIVLNKEESHV